jgi:mechanosensitive ion channel-like protein
VVAAPPHSCFLPPLFAAVLIIIVGWLVANFLSRSILIAAVNARLPEARLLARAAHWGVLLFAVATALTHLGIGKEMVLVAFGITFGGLVFALALAFGLGGRDIAADLLARRLRRESPPPQEHLTHL